MRPRKFEGQSGGQDQGRMTTKKRPIPQQKTDILARRLTTDSTELARLYREVLRLRKAVRRAESRTKRAQTGFDPH